MVLARQMYPGNSQQFLKTYKQATEEPYGYLLVDLKPDTPDKQRLQANVLTDQYDENGEMSVMLNANYPGIGMDKPAQAESLKSPGDLKGLNYTIQDVLEELHQLRQDITNSKGAAPISYRRASSHNDTESEADMDVHLMRPEAAGHIEFDPASVNMPSCLDCGAYYATLPDLKRHQATNCPMSKRNANGSKASTSEDERFLWLKAVEDRLNTELKNEYNARIEELVEQEDKSEEEAKEQTYKEYVPTMRKHCRRALADYFILMRKIQDTDLYRKLMQTVENLMENDEYSAEEAIKQAIKQRKYMIDRLIADAVDEDDDETDEESE